MMMMEKSYLKVVLGTAVGILGMNEATGEHVLAQVVTHSLEMCKSAGIDGEPATNTPL